MWMRKKYGCGLRSGPNTSPFCRSMPGMPRGWRCVTFTPTNLPSNNFPNYSFESQKDIEIKNLQTQLQFLTQQAELIKKRLKELEE